MPISKTSKRAKEVVAESFDDFRRAHQRGEKSKTLDDPTARRHEMREAIREEGEAINKLGKGIHLQRKAITKKNR